MVFNVVPTAFEVALVAGILAVKCGAPFAALTGATIVAYTAFTFSITQVGLLAGCGRWLVWAAGWAAGCLRGLQSGRLSADAARLPHPSMYSIQCTQ